MPNLTISGDLSIDDIAAALTAKFPQKNIRVDKANEEAEGKTPHQSKEVVISYSATADQLQYLKQLLERKTKDMKDMEANSQKALQSVTQFQQQQKALLEEFIALHQKYDDQKLGLIDILWGPCTLHNPALKNISKLEDPATCLETEAQVGAYMMGDELGSGQFATVRHCYKATTKNEIYAIKIIKKDRITTYLSLTRLSDEVGLLKKMQNQFVIGVKDTIQTPKNFYIVTEKGGSDMFEFFDNYDDGVPEPWAKDIMACVLITVNACHEAGVCHRDLKPENILISFDTKAGAVTSFKLCDFGLGSEFVPGVLLSDFCGSPGFFCPEMITQGTYYGDKADIWSISGIVLELLLGNERFTNYWMGSYQYEIMQNKEKFTKAIQNTVAKLPDRLPSKGDQKDFILQVSNCC